MLINEVSPIASSGETEWVELRCWVYPRAFLVETEDQLLAALAAARAYTESYSILDVRLAPDDISPALRRLTEALGKRT